MLLLLAALQMSCGGGGNSPVSPSGGSLRYVALGDSITAGVGASDPSRSYASLFSSFLKGRDAGETFTNLGQTGQTTSGLLADLQANTQTRSAVKGARVITISIGANNLLGCITNPLTGGFSASCAAAGVQQFGADWPQIISQIRSSIGSTANIYVINLYSFYPASSPNITAETAVVAQVNAVLTAGATSSASDRYKLVDVYGPFMAGNLCDLTHICSSFDPHPSDAGHAQIAALFEAAYP